MIYGHGLGVGKDSVQIPMLAAQGKKSGIVRVIGKGLNTWSNVHIEDVVDLYLLALEKAPAGSFYFVENGEESYGNVCAAIAKRLNLVSVYVNVVSVECYYGGNRGKTEVGPKNEVKKDVCKMKVGEREY